MQLIPRASWTYDTKGRFVVHEITAAEAKYKLCKVRHDKLGKGGVPYITTHDGRTIRYVDPDVKVPPSCLVISTPMFHQRLALVNCKCVEMQQLQPLRTIAKSGPP